VVAEQRSFADLVADAVAHLYDLPYLQTHPLSEAVVAKRPVRSVADLRGSVLHNALLDAIRALRPGGNSTDSAHGWRIYRYLFLRYVQAVSPHEVACDLSISDRQSRRVYREAIDALASVFWDRYSEGVKAAGLLASAQSGTSGLGLAVNEPMLERSVVSRVSPKGTVQKRSSTLLDREVRHLMAKGHGSSSDLAEVVEGLRNIVEPLLRQRSSNWSVDIAEGLSRIAVDRSIVRQILLSLLTVLVECCPGNVDLRATQEPQDVRIKLELTRASRDCPGCDQKARSTEARLVVSRRLVEAEGGSLTIGAAGENVTRAVVLLPAERRRTVLVIDDNSDVVTVLGRYLESAGFDVIPAEGGADGFRLAVDRRPDAITLDVMMASQDGWETLQLLKNDPRTQDVPVIVCSVLREEALGRFLGAAEVLPKPVRRTDLLAALARCGLAAPAVQRGNNFRGSASSHPSIDHHSG
jgi:CheY-like chemotaxis protein